MKDASTQTGDGSGGPEGTYSWEQIRTAVERFEDGLFARRSAEAAAGGGREPRFLTFLRRSLPFVEVAGGIALGILVAVMTLIFNYLLFVWILHVNFSF